MKNSALKFDGKWNKELDLYVFNEVTKRLENGEALTTIFEDISIQIETTKGIIHNRWYGSKEKTGLKALLTSEQQEIIRNNSMPKLNKEKIIRYTENDEIRQITNKLNYDMFSLGESQKEFFNKMEELIMIMHNSIETLWRKNDDVVYKQNKLINEVSLLKEKMFLINNDRFDILQENVLIVNEKIKEVNEENEKLLKQLKKML